jgi:mannose-1-phosphate guanylyltransferase
MSKAYEFYAIVMAGGKGTRFWPESTSRKPKQYLKVAGDNSLLAQTLERLHPLIKPEHRAIVTVAEQAELARAHGKNISRPQGPVFEPEGRNTGPCILLALAALEMQGMRGKDVVAVLPSDHLIHETQRFQTTLELAADVAVARAGLVTIGIKPTFPHTGFGYIQRGEKSGESYKVAAFKEKPTADKARQYLASGEYYWNAGMFVATLEVFLQEFRLHSPDMFLHYEKLKQSLNKPAELAQGYKKLEAISFDYAVMEKTAHSFVVPASFDWSDLGSWDALEGHVEVKDQNSVSAALATFFQQATGNIVHAPDKLVAMVGVNDVVVAYHNDALLIIDKKQSQQVKNVVEWLKSRPDLERFL